MLQTAMLSKHSMTYEAVFCYTRAKHDGFPLNGLFMFIPAAVRQYSHMSQEHRRVPLEACVFHRSRFWATSSFHRALKFLRSTASREQCPKEPLSRAVLFTLPCLESSELKLWRMWWRARRARRRQNRLLQPARACHFCPALESKSCEEVMCP